MVPFLENSIVSGPCNFWCAIYFAFIKRPLSLRFLFESNGIISGNLQIKLLMFKNQKIALI